MFREVALSAVADAERSVYEEFKLAADCLVDVTDLLKGEFPFKNES